MQLYTEIRDIGAGKIWGKQARDLLFIIYIVGFVQM